MTRNQLLAEVGAELSPARREIIISSSDRCFTNEAVVG